MSTQQLRNRVRRGLAGAIVLGMVLMPASLAEPPTVREGHAAAAAADVTMKGRGTRPKNSREGDKSPATEVRPTDNEAEGQPLRPADIRQLYQRVLNATAYVLANESGDWSSYSVGTGWIVDANGPGPLLITNHHVVSGEDMSVLDNDRIVVMFPQYKRGKLIVEPKWYKANAKRYSADVFATDPTRDLAVLVLDSVPDGIEPLPLAGQGVQPGERVHSIGNPTASDALWVYTSGTVRQVYRSAALYTGNYRTEFKRVETQSPTNPGDSGGPVVNDRGEVVAVNQGSSPSGRLMTIFVDVSELKQLLKELRPLFHPQDAETFNTRGMRYYDNGRYARAIADFTAAHQLDPKLADALGNRAWSFLAEGDVETAIADFDAAIALDSQDANYHEGRGDAWMAADEPQKALDDYTEAVRAEPRVAYHYHDRGNAFREAGDTDRAIADLSKAIELEPDNAEYYNSRGVAHHEAGEYKQAIEDYDRAIELDEYEPQYIANRGRSYLELDDFDMAAVHFLALEKVAPEFVKSEKGTYDEQWVRVDNRTDEPIDVYLRAYTELDDGGWGWLPRDPDSWIRYRFDPGEEMFVSYKGQRLTAQKIRIYAETADGRMGWYDNMDEPYEICPEEGYENYFMKMFTASFGFAPEAAETKGPGS